MSSVSSAPLYNDIQEFSVSGTWTKPPRARDDDLVIIELWGGGGGGAREDNLNAGGNDDAGGGGGGAYTRIGMRASSLSASVAVTVGAGGLGASTTEAAGTIGGNTHFGGYQSAYGGAGGNINQATGGLGGQNFDRSNSKPHENWGGRGGTFGVSANGDWSYNGGGGGGRSPNGLGGASINGGSGGYATGSSIAPFAVDAPGGAQTPAGGGAGGHLADGGDGAPGFARITVINGG